MLPGFWFFFFSVLSLSVDFPFLVSFTSQCSRSRSLSCPLRDDLISHHAPWVPSLLSLYVAVLLSRPRCFGARLHCAFTRWGGEEGEGHYLMFCHTDKNEAQGDSQEKRRHILSLPRQEESPFSLMLVSCFDLNADSIRIGSSFP